MAMTNPTDQTDELLQNQFDYVLAKAVGKTYPGQKQERVAIAKQAIRDHITERELLARINSLLDLEDWIKLHDLGQEMILDGIEHMCRSMLQQPDQPYRKHTERIKELQAPDTSTETK